MSFSSQGNAQAYLDTSSFTISAQIEPSDFAEWPDSIGAWKVFATYDLDKDGKKEFLVIADPASGTVSSEMPYIFRFEATGNNAYALVWSAKLPGTNPGEFSYPDVTVADMDKDGNQEIFIGIPASGRNGSLDPNPPRVLVYEYETALGNFPTTPTMTTNLGLPDGVRYTTSRVIVENIDSDPEIEMFVSSRNDDFGTSQGGGRTIMIFHLSADDISSGSFTAFDREFVDSAAYLKGGSIYDIGVVDFDGDGKKELWVATWDMLSLAIYETTGPNTYVLQADVNQVTKPFDIGFRSSMHFYDGNKDGKLEMYAAGNLGDGNNPGAVFYVGNVTDVATIDSAKVKRISPWVNGADYDAWSIEGGSVGDIDGDGKVDYFAAGAGTIHRNLYRLEYKSGSYDSESSFSWDSVYYAKNDSTYDFRNVAIANDLDGDNKKEILLPNLFTRTGTTDAAIIILESKVVVTSIQQVSNLAPATFTLEQNFPNPFNPSSSIRFSLKIEGYVELFITNALGQRVGSLVNGKTAAGAHEVTFNADGLSSGTYFYTLKSGNFVETKKMVLLK